MAPLERHSATRKDWILTKTSSSILERKPRQHSLGVPNQPMVSGHPVIWKSVISTLCTLVTKLATTKLSLQTSPWSPYINTVRPAGPKLNSRLPQCGNEYIRSLEKRFRPAPPPWTSTRCSHWRLHTWWEGQDSDQYWQGRHILYASCGEKLQEDQSVLDSLFTQGFYLDTKSSGIVLSPKVP